MIASSRLLGVLGLTAFALCATPPAAAHEYKLDGLTIVHPWARATVGTTRPGAVYVTLVNRARAADRLIGAESPRAARIEMHRSSMAGGVMRMERIDGVDLPARATVKFEPGGLHLMLMGLKAPLAVKTDLPLTLIFEKAGRVEVKAKVVPPGGKPTPKDDMEHKAH